MTRYHGATKTCRYSKDGSVSASASAGRLAQRVRTAPTTRPTFKLESAVREACFQP